MTTNGNSNIGTVRPVKIEEEMRTSYLDYAMSVIVSRALPSAQDGLKPVQRRILYAFHEQGVRAGTRYRKTVGIVGEVMKSYHPHGDSAIYDAMVRMAQDWTLRYPLVDPQGNFGSVDGDPPAAMRYTEARLAVIAGEMLDAIDKETVDFVPNFDDSTREPVVLPARLPNLLVNGASGIAVGMATNIPPHNLNEICDAIIKLLEEPETTTDELSEIVKGPDFPTGGIIYRMRSEREYDAEGNRVEVLRDAVKQTYGDGRGRIVMQARTHVEEAARGNKMQIIVTELPFQVNKASLVERIADLVRNKKVDGISDLRDETDRHGMRIVIELSRTGQPQSVLNSLYKHTAMRSTFPVNMLALVDGQPRVINLKTALEQYIIFRREVIRRRTEFDLGKARERDHILQGLIKALDKLDQVIKTIRGAQSADKAKEALMAKPFNLTEIQAQAVLDMQLRRLARLERQKIQEEHEELLKLIAELEDLLAHPHKIDLLVKEDQLELKEKYGDDRRTQIVAQVAEQYSEEDLVAHQESGGRDHAEPTRLHQTSAVGDVSSAVARRPRHRGHGHARGRRRASSGCRRYTRQPAVLHGPWPRVPVAGLRSAGCFPAGEGPAADQPDRNRTGRAGDGRRGGPRLREGRDGAGHQAGRSEAHGALRVLLGAAFRPNRHEPGEERRAHVRQTGAR